MGTVKAVDHTQHDKESYLKPIIRSYVFACVGFTQLDIYSHLHKVVGFMIYNMGEYTRGYFDGFEKSKKETIETINKMIKDKKYSEKDRDK